MRKLKGIRGMKGTPGVHSQPTFVIDARGILPRTLYWAVHPYPARVSIGCSDSLTNAPYSEKLP